MAAVARAKPRLKSAPGLRDRARHAIGRLGGEPAASARPQRSWPLRCIGAVFGRPIYRLALGVWPDREQLALFRAGMCRNTAPVPPLLRGLAVVPEGRAQLRHLLQLSACHGGGQAALLPPPGTAMLSIPALTGDPLQVWTGPKVGFLHLEKAAGTSFLQFFTGLFHPGQIDPDPCRSLPPHLFARTVPGGIAHARRHALVWGHYDLPFLLALRGDRFLCTVLREPRARILSLYHYWRSVDPGVLARDDGNHTVHLAHALDLIDFLRCDDPMLRDYLDNTYARRLTGCYLTGGDARPSTPCALAALESLAFVGIAERLGPSLAALSVLLDFTPPADAPTANVTHQIARTDPRFRPADRPEVTPAVAAELDRLTYQDREIYNAALAREASRAAP